MARKNFEAWMQDVDKAIGRKVGGLGHLDIDDWHYRDAYDDGMAAGMAAKFALANAGWVD